MPYLCWSFQNSPANILYFLPLQEYLSLTHISDRIGQQRYINKKGQKSCETLVCEYKSDKISLWRVSNFKIDDWAYALLFMLQSEVEKIEKSFIFLTSEYIGFISS